MLRRVVQSCFVVAALVATPNDVAGQMGSCPQCQNDGVFWTHKVCMEPAFVGDTGTIHCEHWINTCAGAHHFPTVTCYDIALRSFSEELEAAREQGWLDRGRAEALVAEAPHAAVLDDVTGSFYALDCLGQVAMRVPSWRGP